MSACPGHADGLHFCIHCDSTIEDDTTVADLATARALLERARVAMIDLSVATATVGRAADRSTCRALAAEIAEALR
jgi:post-segregation antitoxin (ccd killing protein)